MKIYLEVLFFTFVFFMFQCNTPVPNDSNTQLRTVHFLSENTEELSFFIVFVPQESDTPVPVLYLLNGYAGTPYAWLGIADLQKDADKYKMMIVSLTSGIEGTYRYVNSVTDTKKQYESYVLEIIQIVDNNYNTDQSRFGRGICGISNGAMGAIYISSRYPEKFISVSALSGAAYSDCAPSYGNLNNMHLLIDCGLDDPIIDNTRAFHSELLSLGIPHQYNEYPGGHDNAFWRTHHTEHIQFHNGIFERYK